MARRGYRDINGKPVPSVTTVIEQNLGWNKQALIGWTRKVALSGQDPNLARDAAADAGTLTHALVEQEMRAVLQLPCEPIDRTQYTLEAVAQAEQALSSFLAWGKEHQLTPLYAELSLVSDSYGYGGTLDLVAMVDGLLSVVDLKTCSHLYLEHRIQIAAYQALYTDNYIDSPTPATWLVQLRDGKVEAVRYGNLAGEWEVFEALLRLHQLHASLKQ